MDNISSESVVTGQRQLQQLGVNEQVAVSIKDAFKTYEKNHIVLKGLNMTVPKGKIYGLLGPSGCGKTTLINTMVGQSELDSGDIMIEATKREDIGYMPQDINLHTGLTILQTYKFYGRMLNMDMDKIIKRAKELEMLLDLPPDNCLIETLSGGQQRRVSLGVALLHDPNILLLDEPTVGLDPVLSKSIWNHLVSFAKEGKTIIITTHYIEEAKQADVIGMMRDGVLIVEESPEMLMKRCNTTSLEEAFLMFSQKQEIDSHTQVIGIPEKSHNTSSSTKVKFNDGAFRKNRMLSLLSKNAWLILQQPSLTIVLILLPITTIYFYNQAIGDTPTGLNIVVVNDEMQQRQLEKCRADYYNSCFLDHPKDVIMSCAYIELLKSKSFNILHYNEVDVGLDAVKKNNAWGLLHFPNNYTTSMVARFNDVSNTSNIDLELSTVQVWIDNSNLIIGNMMKSQIYTGMQKYLLNELDKCNVNSKIGTIPILFKEPIYGLVNTKSVIYSSTANICLCCYFFPVLFTMGLILTEKNEGMMERMMASGIKFSEVLVSTVIIQVVIHAIQATLAMCVNYMYFDNPHLGDHLTTITMLMLIGMEGMILGFFISAVCNTFMIASYLAVGVNISYCFTSGLVWPLESAHFLLKIISPMLPITAPIKALLAITAKGLYFDSEPVYMGILSIFCWSSFLVISIIILGIYKKDLWVSRK